MDWRIRDNKVVSMGIINKYRLEHEIYRLVDLAYINRVVKKIQKEKKCSELEATIILKARTKEKYCKN